MNNVTEYGQKNRVLAFVFGIVWFVLGTILFSSSDGEFIGFLILAFVFMVILPSLVIPATALRNKLILDKVSKTLTFRSLLNKHIIMIDDIVDIKFPRYGATHIKNHLKRALRDDEVPFIKCYVIEKENPDGVLIPFKSFGEEEFRSILDYIKSVNYKVGHIEYPPKVLL